MKKSNLSKQWYKSEITTVKSMIDYHKQDNKKAESIAISGRVACNNAMIKALSKTETNYKNKLYFLEARQHQQSHIKIEVIK